MDRASEQLEEQRYFAERAADAMLHLERARKARLRFPRTFAEGTNYTAMADHYTALAQVQLIMKEFRQSGVELPDYVRDAWRAEIVR